MDDSASRGGPRRRTPCTPTSTATAAGPASLDASARAWPILVGDLAFVLADELMVGAPPDVWALWNELRIELNVGQYLDLLGSVQRDRRLLKAERIARYKSGKYTVERPLHVGALLAAPDRRTELLPALSAYGLPLGDAFQMRDDVIGAFGETSLTGKPVGDDLREGKPTPLLARAVARADAAQRDVLAKVGAPGLDADEIERHPAGDRRHRRAGRAGGATSASWPTRRSPPSTRSTWPTTPATSWPRWPRSSSAARTDGPVRRRRHRRRPRRPGRHRPPARRRPRRDGARAGRRAGRPGRRRRA